MKKILWPFLFLFLGLSAGLAWDLWAQSTQQYTAPIPYDSGQLALVPDGAGNLYPVLHRGNFGATTNGVAKLDSNSLVVDTSVTYPTGSAAAPGAGTCISAKQTWVQTSGGNAGLLFSCPGGASSTPVAQTAFGDNFNQMTADSGTTINASGASTVQYVGGTGISTASTISPNKVTFNLKQPDGARVTHSVNQSPATSTTTALAFDTATGTGYYNRNAVWASGTNTRLTCKTAGVVLLTTSIEWAVNSSGNVRIVNFRLNGATQFAGVASKPSATSQQQTISMLYNCALNDYFEVVVFQDSGAGLAVNHDTAPVSPLFMMQYLSQ